MNLAEVKRELKKKGFILNRDKSKGSSSVFMKLKEDVNKEVEIRPTKIRGRFQILCLLDDQTISCDRNERGLDSVKALVEHTKPGISLIEVITEIDDSIKRLNSLKKILKSEGIKG